MGTVASPWLREAGGPFRAEMVLISSDSPGVVSSGFHAVAADFHVAPAAGVVLAGVDEQPAARVTGAASEH